MQNLRDRGANHARRAMPLIFITLTFRIKLKHDISFRAYDGFIGRLHGNSITCVTTWPRISHIRAYEAIITFFQYRHLLKNIIDISAPNSSLVARDPNLETGRWFDACASADFPKFIAKSRSLEQSNFNSPS